MAKQIVMQGKGGSGTFKLPRSIAPEGGTLQAVSFITDTTVTANGTNYWSAQLTVGGTSVHTAVTSASTDFNTDTAKAATMTDAAREFDKGEVFAVTVTKASSGADQSAVNWTCVAEYI